MSGSTTPVSSANSYSDADVRAQSVWQAEVNKLKVAQLDMSGAFGVIESFQTAPSDKHDSLQ